MRILLVDDDQNIRAVVRRILTRAFEQLEIVECRNGLEALERLSADKFSLVLLDLNMPVMDGFDVLHSLRRSPMCARLPVIMMSGVNDGVTVRRILNEGVTDYILKPVRPTQLCDRVTRILSGPTQTPANEPRRTPFVPLELSAETPVLVADGSEEFQQFVTKMVSPLCPVDVVSSGLAAFSRCLATHPYAIFIGSDLDIMTGDVLARKLQEHPRLRGVRMIGIEPQRTLLQARKRGAYEAVMLRSFVPDVFMEGLRSLLHRPGAPSHLLHVVPDLKLLVISAAEEALGNALGQHVVLRPLQPARGGHSVGAGLTASMGPDGTPVRVTLSMPAKQVSSVVQKLVARQSMREDQDVDEALPLMLTRFIENVVSELQGRDISLKWEPPSLIRMPAGRHSLDEPSQGGIACDFDVAGEKQPIRIHLIEDAAPPFTDGARGERRGAESARGGSAWTPTSARVSTGA